MMQSHHGPRRPDEPLGPAYESARTWWGLVLKWTEYEDGYAYELSMPVSRPQPLYPRPEMLTLLFSGYWIGAFEDGGTNYLTMWLPRYLHDELLPDGPPPYRYYTEADRDESRRVWQRWMQLGRQAAQEVPPPRRTDGLKLVEIAQAVAEKQERESQRELDLLGP